MSSGIEPFLIASSAPEPKRSLMDNMEIQTSGTSSLAIPSDAAFSKNMDEEIALFVSK
jgi:hypothetical protein